MRLIMADPLTCARGLSTRRAQDGSATAELAFVLCRTRRAGFDHGCGTPESRGSHRAGMSAFGTKRTSKLGQRMSAIGGKADITRTWCDVPLSPQPDMSGFEVGVFDPEF